MDEALQSWLEGSHHQLAALAQLLQRTHAMRCECCHYDNSCSDIELLGPCMRGSSSTIAGTVLSAEEPVITPCFA